MKRRTRLALWCVIGFTVAAGIACNSTESSSPDTPTDETASLTPVGTLTGEQGWPRAEGLRGERYCEVLLARVIDGRLNADVWNTYGLNDCPPDAWAALDAEAIKTERQVIAALLNGPRYWLMDAIEKKPAGERQETAFGTLEMFLAATVDLGPIPPNLAPYTERTVARVSVFEYAAGSEVYELVDPAGNVYVMQSFSQQRDTELAESELPSLASRLAPPTGWTYRARTIDATLRVEVQGAEATVIQDDLGNTYSLIETE